MSEEYEVFTLRKSGYKDRVDMCGNCNRLKWEEIGIIVFKDKECLFRKNPYCSNTMKPVGLTYKCGDYHYQTGITEQMEGNI